MNYTLLHPPAKILVQLLVDAGQVSPYTSLTDWPMFWDAEPDSPDDCVTAHDTAGVVDSIDQVVGEIMEHRGFQLRVRSSKPDVGYAKIEALRAYMVASVKNQLVNVNGTQYVVYALAMRQAILPLGKDVPNSKRSVFTTNGLMSVARR